MQKVAYIEDIIFMNKQNIPWSEVESYLKQYVGEKADDKVKFLVYSSDETKYETKYVHYVDDGESFDYQRFRGRHQ